MESSCLQNYYYGCHVNCGCLFCLLNQQINIGQFIAADIVILAVISSVEKLILTLDKAYDTLTAIEKLDKIKSAELESAGNDIRLLEPME